MVIFGPWKSDLEFKDVQLSQGYETISQHAPLFCQLMKGLSAQSRSDKLRNPYLGRIVLLTSILSLGRAWSSANCFARLPGLYLQGMGVRYRVLLLLYGLEPIDGYNALNCQNMKLAERSKEGHNISGGWGFRVLHTTAWMLGCNMFFGVVIINLCGLYILAGV